MSSPVWRAAPSVGTRPKDGRGRPLRPSPPRLHRSPGTVQMLSGEDSPAVLRHKDQVSVDQEYASPPTPIVVIVGHRPSTTERGTGD
jgi:hypothetical protein